MPLRRSLWIVCLVATLNGLLFMAYQRPDWTTQWTDQDGYRRLAEVFASTGKFTRYPDAPQFVPEVIRTPVYPAFVAVIYRVFGATQSAVAAVQIAVFVVICMTVFAIGRRISGRRLGIAAACATALFPTLPYFAALVLTEVWTTLVFTLTMWALVRAVHEQRARWFAWFGLLAAATALSRPAFVLFLPGIVVMGLALFPLIGAKEPQARSRWVLALAVFVVAMLPWFTYNYVTMHRFTLSPAGGIGRGIWEGSWQGYWPGRVQTKLTDIADQTPDRDQLDARLATIAAAERLDVAPMMAFTHQWQDIRKIWTGPDDPARRTMARIAADNEYLRVGLENITRDRMAHVQRRLTRGLFSLWSADIPIRYSQINDVPTFVIRGIWLVQTAMLVLAVAGLWALARAGRFVDTCLMAAPLIYVTLVHVPLLTEARQSLPAKPIVLILAVLGAGSLTGRSFPLEPQVHERQHL
jgi:4-amino-4-deoxy-L-arabinose transferase-like glycosyltransferase